MYMRVRADSGSYREGLERVAVIDPGTDRAEHEREATWEGASVVLAQRELDRVDSRLNGSWGEADALQLLQLLQDKRLYLRRKIQGSVCYKPGDQVLRVTRAKALQHVQLLKNKSLILRGGEEGAKRGWTEISTRCFRL